MNYVYVIIGLGVLLIVTYLAILISCIKNKNSKKRSKLSKNNQKVTENDKEIESNYEKDDKIIEDISKKSKKEKK